ncbi:MAG: hypothetical protein IJP44_02035 [Bacteroidales bacterium]|nr:hypothetical protein [Bacteroidales bacterium]
MEQLTPLPQFVKFEANGQLSSEYGIAHNGQVTVNWTPTSNDILYAKLYDINGNVMSWDTVHAPEAPQPTGDWVDLGLPSGLLWATRNVGASSPSDYGSYFAWGETSPKSMYNWDTYQYYTCGYQGDDYDCGYTKYCNQSSYGYFGYHDNLTILQPGDDAATANYGGRMPTKEEWQELYNNCTSTWTTLNGVNGRCFTGPNGNSLFLPAAGYRWNDEIYNAGCDGRYWSSSLYTSDPYGAWYFDFYSGYYYMGIYGYRDSGQSVRAVRSAPQK